MIQARPFRTPAEQRAAVPEAAAHLRRGGIVVHPTETVYGLGCLLRDDALDALAALKGRAAEKPFVLLIDEPHRDRLEWTEDAERLARAFWPGPLTLVLRPRPGAFPATVLSTNGTVAVRWSPHRGIQLLLEALGEPMTSTSANRAGEAPARGADEARAVLERAAPTADILLLDGGTLESALPSTIIDASLRPPRLLRRGALAEAAIREIVHGIEP